jgi:hypothetical protein
LATLLILLLSGATGGLRAHEDLHTHPALSVGALLFLDQVNPEDGFSFPESGRVTIRRGSIDEDVCPNYLSHFYDPKTRANSTPDISVCVRPPGFIQQTAPARASGFWAGAVADYQAGRLSSAYTNLGHVFHLLQDMTSPAHVHNDVHIQAGGTGCQDGDDFENWGWSDCASFKFARIYDYIHDQTNASTWQLLPRLSDGLRTIFKNQPQGVPPGTEISTNTGYSFVHHLANKVYDFTTFPVTLRDTFNPDDSGAGELAAMFPSLEETTAPAAWWIANLGYSQGVCNYGAQPGFYESWWLMPGCNQRYESFGTVYVVDGMAYLENTGGGNGTTPEIPETLIPRRYNQPWFTARYGSISNTAPAKSMLRIYGDVLYPAAVAYGAGLLQAFLDEAIMPKPATEKPTQLTGVDDAQLNGVVRPRGEPATAWFEWGASGNYGSVTPPQNAGAGQSPTNLSARIEGLVAGRVYQCRIVSSNRFGVRYGTNQSFITSTLLITSNAPNAWQITDQSASASLNYSTNLGGTVQQAALLNGWRYSVTARMVQDFGGSKTMNFFYQSAANRRFLIWWDLDANGNLTAEIEGQAVRIVATNGLGATLHHTHEIAYANGTATYRFDGAVIGTWSGVVLSTSPAGHLSWGGGSSAGLGQMNFRDVEFEVTGAGAAPSYHAGTHPAVALSPVTQGWTATPAVPQEPNGVAPVSPDLEPYLPLVETLLPSATDAQSSLLFGRADPRGYPARGWFEWGTTPDYGNTTPSQALGGGFGWRSTNQVLNGLSSEQTYHFRFVASNDFAVVVGTDLTFTTRPLILQQPLDTGACLGQTASFTVVPGSPQVTYQWQRRLPQVDEFLDIPGANGATYTTPPLTAMDDGSAFQVVVRGPAASAASTEAFVSVISVGAPNVTYTFDNGVPTNTAIYGHAFIESGVLELNTNAAGQRGAFLTADLAPGRLVRGFTATFKARVQPGNGAADGFSFNWATDLPNAAYPNAEDGHGSGLRVCFDTFNNGPSEAPAIDILWGTNGIAHRAVPVSFLAPGASFFDVQIRLTSDGFLDLIYGCEPVFSRLPIPGYTPQMGARFGLGSRTGSLFESHSIDDLALELAIDAFSNSPRITSINPQLPAGAVIQGKGASNQNYSLETSRNLRTWSWRANVVASASNFWQFVEPSITTPTERFYRLKVFPELPAGLVTWYRADGTYGDSFGPNNGSPENGMRFAAGQRGQAFSFNGTVEAMVTSGAAIPVPWTAAFWVNRHDSPAVSAALLSDNIGALKLEQWPSTRQVGFTQFGVADYSFNYIVPTNTWMHLTFVGTAAGTTLYTNGVQAASLAEVIPLPLQFLGRRDTGEDRLKGLLDEITLFNRALSPEEIQQLRHATQGP